MLDLPRLLLAKTQIEKNNLSLYSIMSDNKLVKTILDAGALTGLAAALAGLRKRS